MRILIIDSHREVLPYWFKEYLRLEHQLVEVRIDKHHDMNHECPVLPATEGRQFLKYLTNMMSQISDYAKREINEANFTCPAFHYGILGALYHFNPREKEIDAYGRVCGFNSTGVPRTREKAALIGGRRINRIFWDETFTKLKSNGGKQVPVPQKITIAELRRDMVEGCYPSVIGFDLDSICASGESDQSEEAVERRLEKAKQVLECVSYPAFAYIARSQTPRTYVPPERVDSLQGAVANLIETIYA